MTARPAFNYRKFVADWRELAAENGVDALTGEPLIETGTPWWARDPGMWENGPNASSVEAEALASIASQARRIAGVPEPETVADAVRAAWDEDGARRERQIAMPLRELHMARGEIVDLVAGVRMLVPVKVA